MMCLLKKHFPAQPPNEAIIRPPNGATQQIFEQQVGLIIITLSAFVLATVFAILNFVPISGNNESLIHATSANKCFDLPAAPKRQIFLQLRYSLGRLRRHTAPIAMPHVTHMANRCYPLGDSAQNARAMLLAIQVC